METTEGQNKGSEYLTNTKTGKSYLNNLLVTSHSRISMETVKKNVDLLNFQEVLY